MLYYGLIWKIVNGFGGIGMGKGKQKQQWLKWLMDFINCDLDHMPAEDAIKCFLEMRSLLGHRLDVNESLRLRNALVTGQTTFTELLFDNQPEPTLVSGDFGLEHRTWEELKSLQLCVRMFFKRMVENIDAFRTNIGQWMGGTLRTPVFQNFHVASLAITLEPAVCFVAVDERPEQSSKVVKSIRPLDSPKPATIKAVFKSSSNEEALLFNLARILDDVPLDTFHMCECGKWFLSLTGKEKHFCSNRCAARAAMRKSRNKKREQQEQETSEEEKRKNAERAHQRYKEQFPPNIKVQRRPYKHK
jgi:hypothetical protein